MTPVVNGRPYISPYDSPIGPPMITVQFTNDPRCTWLLGGLSLVGWLFKVG